MNSGREGVSGMQAAVVRNAWYVADWARALGPAGLLPCTILAEPLVCFRDAKGRIAVLEDRCPHRQAPLSLGRLEGGSIRCGYHGARFDRDGHAIEVPGQSAIAPGFAVRRYPAVERHGWIWVWMGDVEAADEALIPPAIGPEDPDWVLELDQLDYQADAQLVVDNLLDFAHLPYVHAASFGASEKWAQSRPRVSRLPRGVRFERWIRSESSMPSRSDGTPVDVWSTNDVLVPGIVILSSASFPEGTAESLGGAAPVDFSVASRRAVSSQAVTPSTPGRARYFFSHGPHVAHGGRDRSRELMAGVKVAFDEDRRIIEGQQRIIGASAERHIIPIASDAGVTLYHQVLRKLTQAEAGTRSG